jgi:hypothetical protein
MFLGCLANSKEPNEILREPKRITIPAVWVKY